MTNGDRIRELASTNEGLAELVSKYVGCNHCPVSSDCENRQGVCEFTFKKWLKKEILKPCPFCGGDGHITGCETSVLRHEDYVSWIVECEKCGAGTVEYDSEEKAVAAWNRRFENAD